MSAPLCILHILRPTETEPPAVLMEAANVVSIRAGRTPDQAIREAAPMVMTICGPMDYDARVALEKVAELDIPVLGIGTGPADELRASVSEAIVAEDLRSMLEVMHSCSGMWRLGADGDAEATTAYLMEQVSDDIIRVMEHLLSLRMPDYSERADRVVQASFWIGSHLGMNKFSLNDLMYAARLREIGKLSIPDKILFTPRSERTREEQAIYDRYPLLGARVLAGLSNMREAARIVEYQLECFDGGGPAGMISNQIPLGSRILRVASAFEMMVAEHNHSTEEILETLDHGRGSLFDPQLVRLMQNYVHLTEGGRLTATNTQRVKLSDLVEGMVLAEDVWSRSGIKIIARGTRLNAHMIKILMSLPLDASIEFVEIKKAV